MKLRLSELRTVMLVDENGERLGHFADFRCQGTRRPDGSQAHASVQRVIWGTVGVLERLGVRQLADKAIDRRDVRSIERDRIVVRAPRSAKRTKR